MKLWTNLLLLAAITISANSNAAGKCTGYNELQQLMFCKDARTIRIRNIHQRQVSQYSYELYMMTYALNLDIDGIYVANTYHPRRQVLEVTILTDDSDALDRRLPDVYNHLKTKLLVDETFAASQPHFYLAQAGNVWNDSVYPSQRLQFFTREVGVLDREQVSKYVDDMTALKTDLEKPGADWKVLLSAIADDSAQMDWDGYAACKSSSCRATLEHTIGWSSYPELIGPLETLSSLYQLMAQRY